jgi:multidrug efflux pump subunit AcrA (membrane-fusion protein)
MLERLFRLRERGTSVRTEVLGGATTFVTMAYIVVVNLAILAFAGLPVGPSTLATILAAVRTPGVSAAPARAAGPAPVAGVAAEGRVVAYHDAEVRVAAERPGRLVRVPVREGQRVHAGDLLAEIDSDELRAAQAEARARVG